MWVVPTAAICGQIAGAFYGEANIPVKWLERLFMRVEIRNVANQLAGFLS
jgi:ADP-ribosyl-[dinitrogen reductase] hydrolase